MPQELKIQDVERLVDMFKWERFTYLILIAICTILIIVIAIASFLKGDWQTGLSLFAPGGALFLSLSRVFKIWDDIMKVFFILNNNKDERIN